MSKKEEKKQQNRQKAVKNVIVPYIFGIAMLVLGIIGILGNNSALRDYQNSDDIRTVDAEVTYAEIKEAGKLSYESKQYLWDAKLRFTVDGKEYADKDRFYSEVKKGDTVRIEVYRTPDGDYRVPTVRKESTNKIRNILMYAALGLGIVVIAGSTFFLVDELRKNKKGKGKSSQ